MDGQRIFSSRTVEQGHETLEQHFAFPGMTAERLAETLWTGALTGERSLFGKRPRLRTQDNGDTRLVYGFSPVPMFRFDIAMTRPEPQVFVLRLSQSGRQVPYLQGEFVWLPVTADTGAVLEEHINTPRAKDYTSEPLTGPRPSIRRLLFFRVGHPAVMKQLMRNVATMA